MKTNNFNLENETISVVSSSREETIFLGQELAKALPKGKVIAFFGDLAAGKTTFIKGLASGASGVQPDEVNSPTFVYLNIYEGPTTVYHFDLYRLHDANEFLAMGFQEYFDAGGLCLLEWAERIEHILPEGCLKVRLEHLENEDQRRIVIGT